MDIIQQINWTAVFKIISIDIMLGVDNAIVIALACAALPVALRSRAMLFGTAGAIVLRAVLLAVAGLLMGLPAVKLLAGGYLLFVGYKLLAAQNDDSEVASATKVSAAVKTIIIADFMMSLDNVMAVAGAAEAVGKHSTLYAIAGIVFSIPVIILGAKYLMVLMDRFPVVVWAGAGLMGWVGAEMIISDTLLHQFISEDYSWTYKTAGFMTVLLAVAVNKHLEKSRLLIKAPVN